LGSNTELNQDHRAKTINLRLCWLLLAAGCVVCVGSVRPSTLGAAAAVHLPVAVAALQRGALSVRLRWDRGAPRPPPACVLGWSYACSKMNENHLRLLPVLGPPSAQAGEGERRAENGASAGAAEGEHRAARARQLPQVGAQQLVRHLAQPSPTRATRPPAPPRHSNT
jgi:hypothetical protein